MLPDTKNTGKLYRHWTYETYQCCALPVFAHELWGVNQSFFSLFCTLLRGLFFVIGCPFCKSFLPFFSSFLRQLLFTIGSCLHKAWWATGLFRSLYQSSTKCSRPSTFFAKIPKRFICYSCQDER